jgi:hypothetical protein
MRSTIPLGVAAVLSSAIAGYWRWRIQGQAQQAAIRLLQVVKGDDAVTVHASGTIKLERPSTNAVGAVSLEVVPNNLPERPTELRPADPSTSTNVAGA